MVPEKAFGLVLRELRKHKNISQEELAIDAELDRTFISLLERGLRQPTLTTMLQLSEALDIAPQELFSMVIQKIGTKEHRKS